MTIRSIPFQILLHGCALIALLPRFWSWGSFLVFVITTWLTACLGLSIGYHRLLSHRSFKTSLLFERILATLGALSYQFGPIRWVSIHRRHHRHSDTELDPHNSNKGFWYSYIGWLFNNKLIDVCPKCGQHVKDISKDRYYRWLHKYYGLLQIPLAFFLYSLGGWSFVLWGIPLRIVYTLFLVGLVNSITHQRGYRRFNTVPGFNHTLVALLSFGEGYHNNHHEYPNSANLGLKGEFDISWYHILLMSKLGLVSIKY